MIYLDTSVALANLFGEPRRPSASLWSSPLVSSRLFEYELWTRVHARRPSGDASDAARDLLARVSLIELSPVVLARATRPWPVELRTLDALHLSTCLWLVDQGQRVQLATWDTRMRDAARALGLVIAEV